MRYRQDKCPFFFAEKLAEATRKFAMLRAELAVAMQAHKMTNVASPNPSLTAAKDEETKGLQSKSIVSKRQWRSYGTLSRSLPPPRVAPGFDVKISVSPVELSVFLLKRGCFMYRLELP